MWKFAVVLGALASVAYAQPAKSVKLGRVLVLGALPESRVHEIVEPSRPALLACFDKVLAADASITGRRSVVVVFVFDGEGAIKRHDVISEHVGLRTCAATEAATWRFPKPSDRQELEVEMHLELESGRPVPPPLREGPMGAVIGSDTYGGTGRREQPEITGAMAADKISVGLAKTKQTIDRCYTKELGHEPSEDDEAVVTLGVSAKGKLLRMHGHRMETRVERCLQKAFKLVRFPASKNGKPVMWVYPVAPLRPGYVYVDTTKK